MNLAPLTDCCFAVVIRHPTWKVAKATKRNDSKCGVVRVIRFDPQESQ